ncbi:hypothetical protein M758_4G128300 [Ceratodon purpureus]|nr:hypothetical protein M758_4G128300 [Ceratodon purpureus]KAG0619278.1 hypothetical protein M758_4G128300 [Ceratodon purpureus]KAG0619279.1 hypothetical protein M758_4G128300 [Ceratodon purpureus]KAG0619280.1 hypothetical protein M758_4G128300 [Ceratodon purpureus]KAG0619281.1 hypothetical protein M758_4G128300 [Ceratodon purpureus]
MGKRSSISIVLIAFWASVVVVSAQSSRSTEHFTFPGQASNESCANVDCQQGTCVPNDNLIVSILFPYKCECSPGWATLQKIVPLLSIPSLPCNVPNCSLNANCAGDSPASAPSPSSSPVTSANISTCLVPGICGHGTCEPITSSNVSSSFKCVCDSGYANVLNMTGGYCVSQCELNGGCENLNITLPGLSSPPPPGAPTTATNQTANAGCRGISFDSGLCIATALAVAWSFLSSHY